MQHFCIVVNVFNTITLFTLLIKTYLHADLAVIVCMTSVLTQASLVILYAAKYFLLTLSGLQHVLLQLLFYFFNLQTCHVNLP